MLPGKETKNRYSILKVVLRDKVGNLCQVQGILLLKKAKRRNCNIERWNTEPKQFNTKSHLLTGKETKNSYSILKAVLRETWWPCKEISVKVRICYSRRS